MLTSFTYADKPFREQKTTHLPNLKFSSKDIEVLDFILKMKFANVEDIHERFFKKKKTGEVSTCLRWAQFRLSLLTRHKLLKRFSNFGTRYFYMTTDEGYYFLKRSKKIKSLCKPLDEIDIRTFEHDHQLVQIRSKLENEGEASNWISDRELSENTELKTNLPFDCRPDAIYVSRNGERIALELEKARKSKDRYQQKIRTYIKLMTESSDSTRPFERVYFICESASVLELLKYQAELYQYLFKFDLLNHLIIQKES